MKKLLLFILVGLSIILGYSLASPSLFEKNLVTQEPVPLVKKPILRVALLADSHSENDLLKDALRQAQGKGINFVIGLGDYTNLGTIDELEAAKREFDESKFEYFVTAGDRDGWESRNKGVDNFKEVFGESTRVFDRERIRFIILDNSDIYKGISDSDWELFVEVLSGCSDHSEAGLTTVKKRSASLNPNSKLLLRLAQAFVPHNLLHQVSGFYWRDFVMFLTSGKPVLASTPRVCFVFAHKTPFHPESKHVMGENSEEVARQARKLMDLMETTYSCHSRESGNLEEWIPDPFDSTQGKQVGDDKCAAFDGFFSGDLHFFAKYQSPQQSVRITTVGAVSVERNFQGPRFSVLTVFDDYSWEVEDVEIR